MCSVDASGLRRSTLFSNVAVPCLQYTPYHSILVCHITELICIRRCMCTAWQSSWVMFHCFCHETLFTSTLLVWVFPLLLSFPLQALCLLFLRLLLIYALLCSPSTSALPMGQLHLEQSSKSLLFHWIMPPTPQSCIVMNCNWAALPQELRDSPQSTHITE